MIGHKFWKISIQRPEVLGGKFVIGLKFWEVSLKKEEGILDLRIPTFYRSGQKFRDVSYDWPEADLLHSPGDQRRAWHHP